MEFWFFVGVLFGYSDREGVIIGDTLCAACRYGLLVCNSHYTGCESWLATAFGAFKWCVIFFFVCVCSYWAGNLLWVLPVSGGVN